MATPNIVPRADSEGGLGTTSKYWASAYIDTITTTGNVTVGGGITVTGEFITLQNANAEKPVITLISSSNDAEGSHLTFRKDRGQAPVDGDTLGSVVFQGEDSGQNSTIYAEIRSDIHETTHGDESGEIFLSVANNGTLQTGLFMKGDKTTAGQVDVTIGNGSGSKIAIPGRLGVGANSDDVEAALTIKGDPGNTNQPAKITNSAQDTHTGLFLNSTGNAVNEKYGMQFGGFNEYSVGGIFGVMDSTSGSTSGDITIDTCDGTTANALIERVRFTHEGSVGIGTTAPDAKLSVTSTGTSSEDILYLKGAASTADAYLGLAFETNGGGNGPHGAIRVYNGPSSGDSHMSLLTTTDGGTLTKGLTISHNSTATFTGNVVLDPSANSDVSIHMHTNSGALGDEYAWNLIAESSSDNYEFTIAQGTIDVLRFNNTASAGNNNATFVGDVTIANNDATLTLYAAASPFTPKIEFIRNSATFGDDTSTDFRLIDTGGIFKIQSGHKPSGGSIETKDLLILSENSSNPTATLVGIPFYSDTANNSMYTHDVSATDTNAVQNTAYGFAAMDAITTGDHNTAIGYSSGSVIEGGDENVSVGAYSLGTLLGGNQNVAIGYSAMGNSDGAEAKNVAVGHSALAGMNNSTDNYNTAVGYFAGKAVSTGLYNTVLGGEALLTNEDGDNNTAIGFRALKLFEADTDGHGNNTAIGFEAMRDATTGVNNTAVGSLALNDGTLTGDSNTALGFSAGKVHTGANGTFIGAYSGFGNTSGSRNTFVGEGSGFKNTSGLRNTALGASSLKENLIGDQNVAVGTFALEDFVADTDGHGQNTAVGYLSMAEATTGTANTALGSHTISSGLLTGDHNVAIGYAAGQAMTSATTNLVVGSFAGDGITLGEKNVALGYGVLTAANAGSRSVAIGFGALEAQVPQFTDATCDTNHTSNTTTVTCDANSSIKVGMRVQGTGIDTGETVTITAVNTSSVTSFTISHAAVSTNTNTTLTFTGGVDSNNTAVGYNAGNDITTGINNTIVGSLAGDTITSATYNTLVGYATGGALVAGSLNVAVGAFALDKEDQFGRNVAVGYQALTNLDAGQDAYNTAVGYRAGLDVSTGIKNTIIGGFAGDGLSDGTENTVCGYSALSGEGSGASNTAIGAQALGVQDGANNNTALGRQAGLNISTGSNNTAVGSGALDDLNEGANNVALGQGAGITVTTGSNNIYLGRAAVASSTSVNSEIVIGEGLTGLGAGTTRIGGNIQISDLTPTFSAITDSSITLVSGTEYLVNDADGGAMVLPSAGQGKRIIINIGTKITSNTLTITAASGDLLKGFAFLEATEQTVANNKTMFAPDGTDDLIITLDGSTKGGLVGDKIECVGISATEWRVRAILQHTGTAATPFS